MTPGRPGPLPTISIVPVTLRALCLSGAYAGSFADCRRETDANTPQLGVELRWVLPPELRKGTVVRGELRFPAIPDQWLVTRFLTGPISHVPKGPPLEVKWLGLDAKTEHLVGYNPTDYTFSHRDPAGTADHTYFVMGFFCDELQDPLFRRQSGLGTWWLHQPKRNTDDAPQPATGEPRSVFFGWTQASGAPKRIRVLVFAKGEKANQALDAGAAFAGAEELVTRVSEGMLDFDRVIATPDMMGQVAKLGHILGPRGLMPTPEDGTVTPDVGFALSDAKAAEYEYYELALRPDKRSARKDTAGFVAPTFRPCLAPSAATALGTLASQDEEPSTKSLMVAAFSLGLLASPGSAAQHDGTLPSLLHRAFVPRGDAGQTWEIRPKAKQRERQDDETMEPATGDLWTAFKGLHEAQRILNEMKIRALGLEWEAEVLRLTRKACRDLGDQEALRLDRRVTELEKRSDDQQVRIEQQSARVDQELEAVRSQLGTELELMAHAEPPFGEPGAPCLAIKSTEGPQEAWEGRYALSLTDLLTPHERENGELPDRQGYPLEIWSMMPGAGMSPQEDAMRPLFPAYLALFRAVAMTFGGFPVDQWSVTLPITAQLPATVPYDSFQAVSVRWRGVWAQRSVIGESPLHRSLLPTFRHQVAQVVEQALSGDVANSERFERADAIVGGLFGYTAQVMAASLTELRAAVHAVQDGKLQSAGGRFSLEDITLVDHFGRGLSVLSAPSSGGVDPAARRSECVIDLGPRFVVPARHELVPLRADNDGQIASDGDPASSPVAAWLVHSRADHALLVYDCTGHLVGYFQFETRSRSPRWCPVSIQEQVGSTGGAGPVLDATAPRTGLVWSGGAETVALPQGQGAGATSPQVASISKDAFSRLWRAIHRASADPEGSLRATIEAHTDDITSRTAGGSAFAQLFGPPIALVRAKLRLEVVGETNGETEPATVIRLGSATDGLIAVLAPDGTSGSTTFEEKPVAFDAPLSEGGTDCVLLMDPSKGIEVSSELLPRSRFRLWARYTTALDRLEYLLQTFPALIARKPIAQDATLERQLLPGVPVPRHVNGRWSWGYKASEGWRDHPEACADAIEPVIPVNPIEAFDGFLSVTPAGSK